MAADMTDPVDIFIIGGGINGCGIARDAAGRGLSVALAEMNDLASATSSASTKLFHGGLRYLEYLEFRLVREALIERENLLECDAAYRVADAVCAALSQGHAVRGGDAGLADAVGRDAVAEGAAACRCDDPGGAVPVRPSRCGAKNPAARRRRWTCAAIRPVRAAAGSDSSRPTSIPTAGSRTRGWCR